MKYILILSALLCGCNQPAQPDAPATITYHTKVSRTHVEFDYDTVVIDGCEYLVGYRGAFSHKGNCTNAFHSKWIYDSSKVAEKVTRDNLK